LILLIEWADGDASTLGLASLLATPSDKGWAAQAEVGSRTAKDGDGQRARRR